ncbi:MAG: hypothetical protein PWR17_510 [Candidatus Methanomethylophilaceae archaeon]|nr:hypothetical protein [Candidatus Methanomethylophilaceae archaeon]
MFCYDFLKGITPAYAGTTETVYYLFRITKDHPRLRGDYWFRGRHRRAGHGSPPLTRGLLIIDWVSLSYLRITPAYAGTTKLFTSAQRRTMDHPRLRGDYCRDVNRGYDEQGSPPLTRGLLPVKDAAKAKGRITPAYAGTTALKKITMS